MSCMTTFLYCRRRVKPIAGGHHTKTNIRNTSHPYDLVIGLDRSDKKADLCLIDTRTDQRRAIIIDTAPEALWEWLRQLRQQQPQARIGLCLEQPAVHLITFFEGNEWITLYPINPITLQKFREAFVTSRAKAVTATAYKLAKIIYRLLKYGKAYVETGQDQYEEKYRARFLKHLQQSADSLGFQLVPKHPST